MSEDIFKKVVRALRNDKFKDDSINEHIAFLLIPIISDAKEKENRQLKERVDKLTNLLLKSRAMSSFSTAKWNEIRDELLTELKME